MLSYGLAKANVSEDTARNIVPILRVRPFDGIPEEHDNFRVREFSLDPRTRLGTSRVVDGHRPAKCRGIVALGKLCRRFLDEKTASIIKRTEFFLGGEAYLRVVC